MNAGNKGLANLGNTCYMNAALQCLSHLLEFHPRNQQFQKECITHKKEDTDLIDAWTHLQISLWTNDNETMVNPKDFLRAFIVECNHNDIVFRNFDQNDTEEFLYILLNFLHSSLKKPMKFTLNMDDSHNDSLSKLVIDSHKAWSQFYSKDYSYIIDKFYSQQLSVVSCTECDYITYNHEPIMTLQLEIPESASTLYDCLASYTSVSKLKVNNTWTCDKCKAKINPDKKLLLWNCPNVLIIQLKRYTSTSKKDVFIEYPIDLELNNYNLDYDKNGCDYRLVGMCIQDGGLGGGHYYAVCRNDLDFLWREYNDTHVSLIDEDDVLKKRPYCLFYRRT